MKIRLKFLLFLVLGAILLLADALYNGYPLVYSDTSTYLNSGFELETPFDRPITYGLLLRLLSLNGLSLWSVVFFQALLLSYLLFKLVQCVVGDKDFLVLGLICIAFVSLFTGLSWTTSQLMPDVFTPIGLISLCLLLFKTHTRSITVFLYTIFFFSVATHMSHILLFILILWVLFLFPKYFISHAERPFFKKRISILFILSLASILTMGSAISKSRHVFFMGAMVEHGILKAYLDDNCGQKNYQLCAFKDSLPKRAYEFVWDQNSPVTKIGGWKETKTEFNAIIQATLTQPKFILMHIKESLKATWEQLGLFAIGDGNGRFTEGTLLFERIQKYVSHETQAFRQSKQNQEDLQFFQPLNFLFTIVMVISILSLVYIFLRYRDQLDFTSRGIVFLFLLGIILNAWDCATFANALDRLGCKMNWLIPFSVCLWSIRLWHKSKIKY